MSFGFGRQVGEVVEGVIDQTLKQGQNEPDGLKQHVESQKGIKNMFLEGK